MAMSVHQFSVLTISCFMCQLLGCSSGGNTANSAGNGEICDPVAFAMLNVANSNAKLCAAIPSCIAKSCNTDAVRCAGAGYATFKYDGGVCAQYYSCVKTCNCVKSCVDQCDPDSLDCASCLSVSMGMGCTLTCATDIASCGAK